MQIMFHTYRGDNVLSYSDLLWNVLHGRNLSQEIVIMKKGGRVFRYNSCLIKDQGLFKKLLHLFQRLQGLFSKPQGLFWKAQSLFAHTSKLSTKSITLHTYGGISLYVYTRKPTRMYASGYTYVRISLHIYTPYFCRRPMKCSFAIRELLFFYVWW